MKTSGLIRIASLLALSLPGLGTAQTQNLFVADYGTGNIYDYTPTGARSTFANVTHPSGMAFNSAGDLFVTSQTLGTIYEFTPGGVESTFASGLSGPDAIAFDSAGNLYETDAGSGNVYEFTPGGVRSTFASGLNRINGMAFDSSGNLFVACQGVIADGTIVKITPGGSQSVFASGLYPIGLAFNSAGNLFESDSFGVFEFTPGGVKSTYQSITAFGPSGSTGLYGMAFDSAGDLFTAVQNANTHPTVDQIDEVTPGGTESTFANGLNFPAYMAFQPVPEPSVWALLGTGIVTFLGFCRKSV